MEVPLDSLSGMATYSVSYIRFFTAEDHDRGFKGSFQPSISISWDQSLDVVHSVLTMS